MLKKFSPVTPSQRQLVQIDRSVLYSGKSLKTLTIGKSSTGGRNNFGRITCRHKGGGHKKLYRIIDFKRLNSCELEVERIEYDPNRSAFIALVKDILSQEYSYIIAPEGIVKGDRLFTGKEGVDIKIGNCLPIRHIPVGTIVHNVEMKVGKGGQLARAAGTSVQIVGKEDIYAQIKLQSGEVRLVLLDCKATIGVVSNFDRKNTSIGKAGRSRWMGVRPTVRGVAMNPVDHPHGGGEGKTSGGRHPVSPKGKPTKGKKTRRNKSTSRFIIKKRKVGR
jgi:large subunit ribosomal protein L2